MPPCHKPKSRVGEAAPSGYHHSNTDDNNSSSNNHSHHHNMNHDYNSSSSRRRSSRSSNNHSHHHNMNHLPPLKPKSLLKLPGEDMIQSLRSTWQGHQSLCLYVDRPKRAGKPQANISDKATFAQASVSIGSVTLVILGGSWDLVSDVKSTSIGVIS